jgi:hypothetical protein
MKLPVCLLIVLLALFRTSLASAAEMPEPPEEARQHFRRGIDLYEERDFNGATVEFRRAYQLAPHFRILYNLAQSAQELHDWVSALDYFTRYLKDGVGQIPEERRAAVEQEMSKLRKRVGKLMLVAHGPASEVLVDGVPVARTPVAGPLNLNLGRHRIELRTEHGTSHPHWVDCVGGETALLELSAPQASVVEEEVEDESEASPVPAPSPASRASGSTSWWAWLVTGLCAAGATTTGIIAYRWSRDLHDQRDFYPVTQAELRDQQRKVERMSWATDGLLAGTVVFAGISLFLTLRNPETGTTVSIGPTGLSLRSMF